VKKKSSSLSGNQKKDLIKVYRDAIKEGVALDKIEKKLEKLSKRFMVADKKEKKDIEAREKHFRSNIPKAIRMGAAVLPTLLLLVGISLVGSATYPILAYYVEDLSQGKTQLSAPVPPDQVLATTSLALNSSQGYDADDFGVEVGSDEPIILDSVLDYTNLSNWFSGDDLPEFVKDKEENQISSYILDIPKVDVKNAIVAVGGSDLNKSLIQYPGTALPGQAGAPVIFGHSVLRQFYSPKEANSRRYTSLFSYIMTLERGDKIYVTVEGIRYTYVVQSKNEVKPTDTYILSQRYDTRQLKLVTCTPEGTYLRRGVVTAQLVKDK
jgi:LPXTG-site transpeptidase (sortase) family protein